MSLDAKRGKVAVDLAASDVALAAYDDDAKFTVGGVLTGAYARPGTTAPSATSAPKPTTTSGASHLAAMDLPSTGEEVGAARGVPGIDGPEAGDADAAWAGDPLKNMTYSKAQTYSLTWTRTLYDFGRTSSHHDQLVAVKDVKTLALGEIDEALVYRVARAYASMIAAERLVALARDQVDLAQSKLKEQKNNYQKGLKPESDVVTAEVEVGRAGVAGEKALDDARAARLALGQAIGRAGAAAMQLTAPATALKLKQPAEVQGLVAHWTAPAPSASMKRRQKERDAIAFDQAALDAAKRPTLNGSVSFQEAGGIQDKPNFKPYLVGQLAFAWDLPWNGMSRDEREKIALRGQDLALQDDVDIKARADKDKAGRDGVDAAARQWDALTKQLALTVRQRDLTKRRYDLGKASALELAQTETDLINARGDLARLSGTLQLSVIDVAEAHSASPAELSELFK